MRVIPLFLIVLSGFGASACAAPPTHPDQHAEMNKAMIQLLNRAAIDNAVVRQHTIFSYHFIEHTAELNELGLRDLGVLAAHYRAHPGVAPLNVRRGDVPVALYEARIQTILRELERREVAVEDLDPADGMPGGDGTRADRVVRVLAVDRQPVGAGPAGGTDGLGVAR